jgi:HSP20 family molecular chaperone IbpA
MTLPVRRNRFPGRRWDSLAGLPGFDDLLDQMSRILTTAFPDVARISINSWSPPVDIQETDDGQGPPHRRGVRRGGAGRRRSATARRTGRFDYRLTLPGEVNSESCTADLEKRCTAVAAA